MRIESMGSLGGRAGHRAIARLDQRDVLGVKVATGRADTVVAAIEQRLEAGEIVKLAFLNAHASNLAAGDARFRAALDRFLVLNDGLGLAIASRVIDGRPFPQNLNGTDFVPRLLATTRHSFRLFLLGARPGIAERAAARIADIAPHHAIAGVRDGFFAAEATTQVVAQIRAAETDALLVALGNPAQEIFIAEQAEAAGVRLAVGVGALFDFLAGEVPRAPRALRRAGLEWAFRLAIEPGRLWRRYLLGNPRFLARVVAARLTARSSVSSGGLRR
jgi:exopolysaccharide biosynthesis WecB/TagA/CpsF family protein